MLFSYTKWLCHGEKDDMSSSSNNELPPGDHDKECNDRDEMFELQSIQVGAKTVGSPSHSPVQPVDGSAKSAKPKSSQIGSTTVGLCTSISRGTRGPNRSLGLEDYVRRYGKVKIYIQPSTKKPVGEHSEWWSRAMTNLIKQYAPVQVDGWSKIPASSKEELYRRMQTNFLIDLDDPIVRESLHITGTYRYKQWRNRLHEHYLTLGRLDRARDNPPEEFTGESRRADWLWLCDLFESPEWKEKSSRGQEARSKQQDKQRGGSNSYANRAYLKEQMLGKRQESPETRAQVLIEDICEDVPDSANGDCHRTGLAPRPLRVRRARIDLPEVEDECDHDSGTLVSRMAAAEDLIHRQQEEILQVREELAKQAEELRRTQAMMADIMRRIETPQKHTGDEL